MFSAAFSRLSSTEETGSHGPAQLFGQNLRGLFFRQGDLDCGQESLQVAAVVGDEGQRSGTPHGQRQHGGDARHRSPAIGALHQPHPDGAHHGTADIPGRVGEGVGGQKCGVTVGAFVTVGEMFGGFQPSQLVQLPGGEGVQPFVAQTAVFTEQFHLKSPPFRRRSAARPASFLPGRPAPPLFSGACRRAGRLRRRCAVPAA